MDAKEKTPSKNNPRRGTIVRVINPDARGYNQQGWIETIFDEEYPDGNIGVCFPKRLRIGFNRQEYGQIVRFWIEELQLESAFDPLTADELAIIVSGSKMIRTIKPILPLVPGETTCFYQECDQAAWFVTAVNCWGTLYIGHMCPRHAVLHGQMVEGVPWKKEIEFQEKLNPAALDDN